MSDMAAIDNPSSTDRKLRRDLKTLARFVQVYCKGQHGDAVCDPFTLKLVDMDALWGRPLPLCAACRKLLAHAFVMRINCPYDPKPACKKCPTHCYEPNYRKQIREVMRYSGRRLVLSGRLDYLFRLFS